MLGEENGIWHRARNKKRKARQLKHSQHCKLKKKICPENLFSCTVTYSFFPLFFVFFNNNNLRKTRQKLSQSEEEKKTRSSRVTTRDGCCSLLKGHGSKTNNESRAVLPPLQKAAGKKKPQRVQEALWDFLLFFL